MIKKKNAVWPYGPYRYKTDEEWAEMLRHRGVKKAPLSTTFQTLLDEKIHNKGEHERLQKNFITIHPLLFFVSGSKPAEILP